MRTLFVPTATSWSFPPQSTPAAWALPVGNPGGTVYLQASTFGSTPVDGEGVTFEVSFDGVLAYTSACMENGVDTVPVPPGTLTIDITSVNGCNAGPDVTTNSVWAVST